MISINDIVFSIWILVCFTVIIFTAGRINKKNYSRLMLWIFILSCLMTIWFHETVIDVSKASPLHGAMLVFAQMFTMTLSSKMWLSFNIAQLSRYYRIMLYSIFYSALLIVIICSYWLYKIIPELQLILYPFASLSISVTAQLIDDRWK